MQSTQIKAVELKPLKDNDKDFEAIEKQIREIWRQEIYLPLIRELKVPAKILKNAKDDYTDLLDAIRSGRLQFYRGQFSGRFNASISKDLKALGAKWDRKTGTFKLPQSSLTIEVRNAISASESHFRAKIADIDKKLAQILPEDVAEKLNVSNVFDQTLWKVEKNFQGSIHNLTIAPQLTKHQSKRLADEWQNNLKLPIKDWTQKEVEKLRKDVQVSIFAGNRHEAAIKIIQRSHQTSIAKAKFLARQETRLLLTKFKQTRYEDAGVNEYRWGISNHTIQPKGAPYVKGEVRHDHGVLDGKIFRWDNPPVTNQKTGARNNPGQDYNCRCFAIPIVKFKQEKSK